MNTYEQIMSRRSVRKYTSDPIPDDILGKMIDAARFAPSWANTQCARFIVIRDEASRKLLAEAFPPRNPGYNSLLTAPVVVVAFAEKNKSGFYKGEPSTNKGDSWYMFDTALALQNMVLTAWEQGIGSVYLGLFDAEKARAALNIPDRFEVVAVVPFGYCDETPKCPPRKDVKDIVFYDTFVEPNVE